MCADLGTALDDELWRKDVTMMKADNVNAIRTSHYPYGSGFYDVCDELGMYVMDEEAACWVPTDTDELTPAFAQHARELVRRYKNHPSVLVWAVGNENAKGKNNKVAAEEIRKIDPTRPRLVSWEMPRKAMWKSMTPTTPVPAGHRRTARDGPIANIPRPISRIPTTGTCETAQMKARGNPGRWSSTASGKKSGRTITFPAHSSGSGRIAVADKCPTKLYDYYPATGSISSR